MVQFDAKMFSAMLLASVIICVLSPATSLPIGGYSNEWLWLSGLYTTAVYATRLANNSTESTLLNSVCILISEKQTLRTDVTSTQSNHFQTLLQRNIEAGCRLLKTVPQSIVEESGSGDVVECSSQELDSLFTLCAAKRLFAKVESIYNVTVQEYRNVKGVHQCRWIEESFESPDKEELLASLDCN